MKLYRAMRTLDKNGTLIPAGSVFPETFLSANGIGVLEKKGSIVQASDPPLNVLPDWKARSKKLGAAGVVRVSDLIAAEDATLAVALNVNPSEIPALKKGLLDVLASPQRKEN